ncbi:MAG: hypothetical protein VXZ82_17570 [Planctomycetota bacterium]|nr:hypothetical protein [Planctomycetota bacterium]
MGQQLRIRSLVHKHQRNQFRIRRMARSRRKQLRNRKMARSRRKQFRNRKMARSSHRSPSCLASVSSEAQEEGGESSCCIRKDRKQLRIRNLVHKHQRNQFRIRRMARSRRKQFRNRKMARSRRRQFRIRRMARIRRMLFRNHRTAHSHRSQRFHNHS